MKSIILTWLLHLPYWNNGCFGHKPHWDTFSGSSDTRQNSLLKNSSYRLDYTIDYHVWGIFFKWFRHKRGSRIYSVKYYGKATPDFVNAGDNKSCIVFDAKTMAISGTYGKERM